MNKIIALCVVLCTAFVAQGQIGQRFPSFNTENISGSQVVLPATCKGKYTLVGMAMSRDAEDHLRSWAQPVYDKFISKNKVDIWDESYDVFLYFIPVFSGVNQTGFEQARKQAVEHTDPDWHPHFLFYRGAFNDIRNQLKMEDKSRPYFFVLDPSGKIVYMTSGSFTQKKIEAIEEILDN